LMTTTLVSAKKSTYKSYSKGYGGSAYAYGSGGCEGFYYGPEFSISAYSTASRFSSSGSSSVTKQSSKFDEFYMYFSTSTCDSSTVTVR
jgi:hypothetical protein